MTETRTLDEISGPTIAARTLVKSAPELWEACSDAATLARHLGSVGEITITRLEPETTVAWEGDRMSGTVRIEPAGWGTRVTLTAAPRAAAAPRTADAAATAEMAALRDVETDPATDTAGPSHTRGFRRRRGLLGWLRDHLRGLGPPGVSSPAVRPPLDPPPDRTDASPALEAALDSLGQAHHRPFSRG